MRLSASPASGRHLLHTSNTPVALLMCALVAMLVGTFAVPSTVYAQAVTGTLLGNVTDSSGGAVPGATVTATETQTNSSRTAVSNEAGHYIFSSLRNGTYTVEAELQGFRKVIRQNVRVDVNTTMRVDLSLELGQVTESVTVAADTPLLQTDRTDTGRLLESKVVTEIPLGFNRNFQGLLVTVPGATRPFRPHSQFFNSQDSLSTRDQRPAAHGEQHADRRAGQQSEDGPAERHHPGRRRARDRQRLDQQLRRRIRPLGRRDHQRDAQVRHEPVQWQRVLLRQHRGHQRQRLLHSSESADEVRAGRVHARRTRSSGTSSSSSATISGRSTTSVTSCARRFRRWRCATATSAPSPMPSTTRRPARSTAAAARRLRTTRSRRTGSARSRASCLPSFRNPTSPARRSARTTTRRPRFARRRPTPSTRS